MAKKESLLDGILGALGESGGDILSELLGGDSEKTESSLGGLFEGGDGMLDGLGDLVADLTGIGASNPDASPVAKQTGEVKSSSTKKKVVRSASGKAASKAKKAAKTAAKKTAAKKAAPAASTAKKKSSTTKKKTV